MQKEIAGPSIRRLRFRLLASVVVIAGVVVLGLTDIVGRTAFSDYGCYAAAAAALAEGRDPYLAANPQGLHYLYPPLLAVLLMPARSLALEWQVFAWYLLSVLAAWLSYREARRILPRVIPDDPGLRGRHLRASWPTLAPILSVAMPAVSGWQRGQVVMFLLYFMMAGLRLALGASRQAWLMAGLVLAAAVSIKPTPGLAVAALLAAIASTRSATAPCPNRNAAASPGRRVSWMAVGLLVGWMGLTFVLPGIVVGWRANWTVLTTFVDRVVLHVDLGHDMGIDIPSPANQSFWWASRHFGNWVLSGGSVFGSRVADGPIWYSRVGIDVRRTVMDAPAGIAVRAAGLLLVAVVTIAAVWRLGRRGGALDLATAFGLGSMAGFVFSPISWHHQWLLTVPALGYVPLWFWRRNLPRPAFWLSVGAVLPPVLHYTFKASLGATGLLGVSAAAWLGAASIVMVWTEARPRPFTWRRGGSDAVDAVVAGRARRQ